VDAVARPMKRGGMPLEMDSNLQFRRDILVALAAFIIIALTAGASYFAFLKDKETYKRLTGKARADITKVYARRESFVLLYRLTPIQYTASGAAAVSEYRSMT